MLVIDALEVNGEVGRGGGVAGGAGLLSPSCLPRHQTLIEGRKERATLQAEGHREGGNVVEEMQVTRAHEHDGGCVERNQRPKPF